MDHWIRIEAAIAKAELDGTPIGMAASSMIQGLGAAPMGGTPADYRKLFDEDYARWAEVVKVSGAKID